MNSIKKEDADTLLEKYDLSFRGDPPEDLVLYDGDLTVDRFEFPDAVGLIVDGNLNIDHGLYDGGRYDQTLLIVTGSIQCRYAVLGGEVLVGQNFDAAEFISVNSSNDYGFEVHGDVTTKIFHEGGMASFANRFHGEVWRVINVVRDSENDYPKRGRDPTKEELLKLGVAPDLVEFML